jgi:4-diphosphocytidyl-2-C-methyl-D-erythritol kinase
VDARLRLSAPAKINLYLAVGALRHDGHHDVVTVMQALGLHDTVELETGRPFSVSCDPELGVPVERNLAAIAARSLGALIGREPSVAIKVVKRIPAAGGLGGGSADAAAVLFGLAHLWSLGADDPRVLQAARTVGADVAFFLGGGTALFSGRGDMFERRLPTPGLAVALLNPGVPISTAAAYAAFDGMPQTSPPGPAAILAALQSGAPDAVGAALYNNLTEPACGLAPEVAEALALLEGAEGVYGRGVAGSGSTVFGVFADDTAAEVACHVARARGWWARATRSSDCGISVLSEHGGG